MIPTLVSHNRSFIYEPRGFTNIQEHDAQIIKNWNSVVSNDDEIFHLGDVMLGDNEYGLKCLKQLNGKIHIIRGNHCTDTRIQLYSELPNVAEVVAAKYLRYNGYHFYMSHYPTITANLEKESLKQCTVCLYGHTHQQTNFYYDLPFCYHVGVDSHNCTPVLLDDAIKDCENKVKECIERT